MAQDPTYLRHLGALATLRNFLGSRYYQTVWEDFSSDEEIWKDYVKRTDSQTIQRLVEQSETLLQQPPEAVDQFLTEAVGASGGLHFAHPHEAAAWLHHLRTYMLSVLSQTQQSITASPPGPGRPRSGAARRSCP
jgi:hypothetical protein